MSELRELARAWVAVGTQSVGGGTSTLLVMRRLVVDRHRWVSGREFTETWALSQLSPGIHLVALAGLLGRRVAGARGVAVSVTGMMLPSAVITGLLTAGYAFIAQQPLAVAALAGIAPVTAGMTMAQALILVRPSARPGLIGAADWLVVVSALLATLALHVSTIQVIVTGALVGALLLGRRRPTSAEAAMG